MHGVRDKSRGLFGQVFERSDQFLLVLRDADDPGIQPRGGVGGARQLGKQFADSRIVAFVLCLDRLECALELFELRCGCGRRTARQRLVDQAERLQQLGFRLFGVFRERLDGRFEVFALDRDGDRPETQRLFEQHGLLELADRRLLDKKSQRQLEAIDFLQLMPDLGHLVDAHAADDAEHEKQKRCECGHTLPDRKPVKKRHFVKLQKLGNQIPNGGQQIRLRKRFFEHGVGLFLRQR